MRNYWQEFITWCVIASFCVGFFPPLIAAVWGFIEGLAE